MYQVGRWKKRWIRGRRGGEWNFEEEKKRVKRGNGSKRKRRKMIKKRGRVWTREET